MKKFLVLYSGEKAPTTPQEGPASSILQANDLAGAAGLIKQCPIIAEGGKVPGGRRPQFPASLAAVQVSTRGFPFP
jgi:hypothetical protein